jgi:DNA-binding beta-propeller fold protein YncE
MIDQAHRGAVVVVGVLVVLGGAQRALAADQPAVEPVQTIVLKGKAGNLDHVAIDQRRGRLFVANKANNTMDIVDLAAGKLLKQVPGQQAIQGIAYAPDLDRVYVGLGGKGLFNVFDGNSYRLLKTIKFQDDSDNVRYDPRKHVVYVAHAENSLAVVDCKSYAVKTDIKLPGEAEGFQLDANGRMLYVAIPSPSQVVVIDTGKNEVAGSHPIKAAEDATALALDDANHRIFVGCRKPGMLVVLDAGSGKEVATVPIPGEVDDLFYDAQRHLLYASCGEGAVALVRQVDADHYEAAGKVDTAKGAKTSLFVPESSKLYVAVPQQQGKPGPEVRVYQVR